MSKNINYQITTFSVMKVYIFSIVLLFTVIDGYSQFLQKRGISPDGHVFDMELKGNVLCVG